MTDLTREIVYNVAGQEVAFYLPEWDEGIPSSVTCSVYDGRDGMDGTAEFSPTVTIDAVSTTVDVVSGYAQTDRRKLSVAATTSIQIGRQYLLENVDLQRELVTPSRVVSADYLEFEDELKYAYPITTSTLKGLRCTLPVTNAWAQTETNVLSPRLPSYQAVINYTVNALVRQHTVYLRLVRRALKHTVTLRDLQKFRPDLAMEEFRGHWGKQFTRAIQASYELVRMVIRNSGFEPSQVLDLERMNKLVEFGALDIAANHYGLPSPGGGNDRGVYATQRRDDFQRLLDQTIKYATTVDLDLGTDGIASKSAGLVTPTLTR